MPPHSRPFPVPFFHKTPQISLPSNSPRWPRYPTSIPSLFPVFPQKNPQTPLPSNSPGCLHHPTASLSLFPVFSRHEHDGGGLGDEASAAHRGHGHQLPADGGPDQLPGALSAPRTRLRPRSHGNNANPTSDWIGEGWTMRLEGRKKLKTAFFFFFFGLEEQKLSYKTWVFN